MCLKPEPELTLTRHRQATILQQEVKPDGVEVEGCVTSGPSGGLLGFLGALRAWRSLAPPPQAGMEVSAPQPSLLGDSGAKGRRSSSDLGLGARGSSRGPPRLHPRSWFKLVWAGCGLGRLHSGPRACRLPHGLPRIWGPKAGGGGGGWALGHGSTR